MSIPGEIGSRSRVQVLTRTLLFLAGAGVLLIVWAIYATANPDRSVKPADVATFARLSGLRFSEGTKVDAYLYDSYFAGSGETHVIRALVPAHELSALLSRWGLERAQ